MHLPFYTSKLFTLLHQKLIILQQQELIPLKVLVMLFTFDSILLQIFRNLIQFLHFFNLQISLQGPFYEQGLFGGVFQPFALPRLEVFLLLFELLLSLLEDLAFFSVLLFLLNLVLEFLVQVVVDLVSLVFFLSLLCLFPLLLLLLFTPFLDLLVKFGCR